MDKNHQWYGVYNGQRENMKTLYTLDGIEETIAKTVVKSGKKPTDLDLAVANLLYVHSHFLCEYAGFEEEDFSIPYMVGFRYDTNVQNLIENYPLAADLLENMQKDVGYVGGTRGQEARNMVVAYRSGHFYDDMPKTDDQSVAKYF